LAGIVIRTQTVVSVALHFVTVKMKGKQAVVYKTTDTVILTCSAEVWTLTEKTKIKPRIL
jgi:hypothetical protein